MCEISREVCGIRVTSGLDPNMPPGRYLHNGPIHI